MNSHLYRLLGVINKIVVLQLVKTVYELLLVKFVKVVELAILGHFEKDLVEINGFLLPVLVK